MPSETTSKSIHSFRPNKVAPRLGKANFKLSEKAHEAGSVINSHAIAQRDHDPSQNPNLQMVDGELELMG